MPRVLQLIDPDHDADARAAVEAVGRADTDLAALPVGVVPLAAVRVRKMSHDLVHAVGNRGLAAAVLGSRRPVVFSPGEFPTRRLAGWLRAIAPYRHVTTIVSTETARRFLVTRGVKAVHVIRPAAPTAALRRDTALRAALGFDDSHRVLLALGASTPDANHGTAAWMTSLLAVLDDRYRLLTWGDDGHGRSARGLAHMRSALIDPRVVMIARDLVQTIEADELLAAADVAVVTATGPVAVAPVARALAAGVPIIATTTPCVSELIEDRHTALLVRDASPRDLARRVENLYANDELRWKIVDRARAEAFDFFTPSRITQAWKDVLADAFVAERGAAATRKASVAL